MQKREKVIVIMAVIAALYGVVDFTLTSRMKKAATGTGAPRTETTVAGEPSSPPNTIPSESDRTVDRLAASLVEPWPGEIFHLAPPVFGKDQEEEKLDQAKTAALDDLRAKALQMTYSGFLAMGEDRIAIINGMDYRVGEEVNGFTISKISQDTVEVTAQGGVFTVHATSEAAPAAAEAPISAPN